MIFFLPYAVWTGSFNLTYNGGKSMENVVYIKNPSIARLYTNMYKQIFALLEPLNWKKIYCAQVFNILNIHDEERINLLQKE